MKHVILLTVLLVTCNASASWLSKKIDKAEVFVQKKVDKLDNFVSGLPSELKSKIKDDILPNEIQQVKGTIALVNEAGGQVTEVAKTANAILILLKWPLIVSGCSIAILLASVATHNLRKLFGLRKQSAA